MLSVFFRKFGLTNNEQAIYLFLLGHGYSMTSMIGKRLNIKRVTAYAALESLERKNLVTSFKKNNINYFEAVSSEKILHLCAEKITNDMMLKKEAEAILPALKKLEQTQMMPILEVKGKIKYYQGIEAVKDLIDETIEENSREQLCFGLNQYHINNPDDYWRQYTKKRVSAGMHVKSIQPDTKAALRYQGRDKDELRITRLVPQKKFPANCELNVIGDMIALFTVHNHEPTGTKIYNKEMAQVLHSLFALAWERAEEYDKKSSN